jgi:DNA-binding transcriptional ArsR family regulator
MDEPEADRPTRSWTFLTNHARVLLTVTATPDIRLRDIAERVGITERTAMQILTDLEGDGYVRKERRGRRNHYTVDPDVPLRHPLEDHHQVGSLLDALRHREPTLG